MKTLIPWLCVILAVAGAGYLYSANGKKDAELAKLRATAQELETLQAENAELKETQISKDEIARLRKEGEDALRLRNEVRQLRDQQQQLTKQLQSAQSSVERQQEQVQKLQTETVAARAAAQQSQQTLQLNACINNLRQLDGAKQQWALEHTKPANAVPTEQEIVAYIPGNAIPQCPAGGKYILNAVDKVPTCTIPGHALQQ